ncbi:MAG: potassium channel family protein [Thermoleophilaceae bacterium]
MSERRALSQQHGYGVVLALVLAAASFQVAAPDADWSRLVSIGLGAATLVTAVWAARAEHTVARVAAAATVVLTLVALVVLVVRGDVPEATAALVNGLLIAVAPAVIATGVVRDLRAEGAVTVRTLSGVLAIYLLLGMVFSLLGSAVAAIDGGPYFAGEPEPTRSDFLYFSYVTLSTTGFGDLSPVTDVGRMLAVIEALIGQIYLVTVVAMIVANLRPRAARR